MSTATSKCIDILLLFQFGFSLIHYSKLVLIVIFECHIYKHISCSSIITPLNVAHTSIGKQQQTMGRKRPQATNKTNGSVFPLAQSHFICSKPFGNFLTSNTEVAGEMHCNLALNFEPNYTCVKTCSDHCSSWTVLLTPFFCNFTKYLSFNEELQHIVNVIHSCVFCSQRDA